MDILYPRCAGLDVHKKTVVACCIAPDESGQLQEQVRTFSTMTADLLEFLPNVRRLERFFHLRRRNTCCF